MMRSIRGRTGSLNVLHFLLGVFLVCPEGGVSLTVRPSYSDVLLNSNTNFTVVCQGEQVIWQLPHSFVDSVHIADEVYGTTLQLIQPTWRNSGRYTCKEASSSESKDIDIFIPGQRPEEWFVPQDHTFVTKERNMEATIPCVVSDPQLSVSLHEHPSGEPVTRTTYEPGRGFTGHLEDIAYVCLATHGGEAIESQVYYVFTISDPTVNATVNLTASSSVLVHGQALTLTCKVRGVDLVRFSWEIPNTEQTEPVTDFHSPNEIQSSIIILKATMADSGVYVCMMSDVNGQTITKNVTVKILEPVRLVGGASGCAGTMEVFRGDWRPVIGSYWTLMSAAVVCGKLNCGSAVSTGIRNELTQKSAWEIKSDCVQAGLILSECVSPASSSSIIEITCSDSVRLVNGTSLCSGRLEVKSDQSDQWWLSVCEADFDWQDAEVVCRELGCGAPSVLQGALYGEVEAPMWTKEFQCWGHESALLACRSSDSGRNMSSCRAVGLTCSEPADVRLAGGASRCAGTLEMKQGGWRPVIGFNWSVTSLAVVCRKLNCGSAVSTRTRTSDRPAWEISSDCVQSRSALRECVSLDPSSVILELTCSDPAVFIIRAVVLLLTLLLFITVLCFIHKTTRGQKDHSNLCVCRAEEEGAPAAE